MAWTDYYVDAAAGGGGNGSSGTPWNTIGAAITGLGTVSANSRVNVKAGTYSEHPNFNNLGTSDTSMIWWRGYNTTIGDCDTNPALTKPTIAAGNNQTTASVSSMIFSSLTFTSSIANTGFSENGGNWYHRCRFISTGTGGSLTAALGISNSSIDQCYISATTTGVGAVFIGGAANVQGCVVVGGNTYSIVLNSSNVTIVDCIIYNGISSGINILDTTGTISVFGNTIHNFTDGITFNSIPSGGTAMMMIANNILSTCTNGINNTSGGPGSGIQIFGNDFYNCTSNITGQGDTPVFNGQTESGNPFTNTGTGDFSLITGANARSNAAPITFENLSTTNHRSIGATQPASGGAFLSNGIRTGGRL